MIGGLGASGLFAAARSIAGEQAVKDLSHLTPEQRARYEAMHKRMMAALTYERVTVSGKDALAEWERLKASGRGWPVVIGSDEDLERIADQFTTDDPTIFGGVPGSTPRPPAQILAAAEAIRFPADLQKWSGAYRPEDLRAPLGDWPTLVGDHAPDVGPSIANDLMTGAPHDRVHILLLPAGHGWEAPAYLRWGNWNACPPPEYHVAALRDWNRRYGAELVAVNGDMMNVRVRTRPRDRAEAVALARDMYGYCPDIIDQGAGSISSLAAGLMESDWWYFWWD